MKGVVVGGVGESFEEEFEIFCSRNGLVIPRMYDVWLEWFDGSSRDSSPPKEVLCSGRYGRRMPAYGRGRMRSIIAWLMPQTCWGFWPRIMIGRPRRARSYRI